MKQLVTLYLIAEKKDIDKNDFLKSKFPCRSTADVFINETKGYKLNESSLNNFYLESQFNLRGAIIAYLEEHNRKDLVDYFNKLTNNNGKDRKI